MGEGAPILVYYKEASIVLHNARPSHEHHPHNH